MIKFEKYTNKPNTISKGTLYVTDVQIPGIDINKKRKIRVYLPSDYNNERKYPVLYMMDGQNLFDKHTSFMGEWGVDEVIEERIDNNKESFIVVGIDSSPDLLRVEEMLPDNNNLTDVDEMPNELRALASIQADWIVKELKPEIDLLFNTLKDKDNTCIWGSSMGGLFAFYMGFKYPNIFGISSCFSPAFCLYDETIFKNNINKLKLSDGNKVYLLVGNIEYEHQFISLTKYTYEFLKEKGLQNLRYILDEEGIHHESFWNKYVNDVLDFIVNK